MFSKYDKSLLKSIDVDKIIIKRSSSRAVRGFCSTCKTPIFMLYDNSNNIWIISDVFKFDFKYIEIYDIFKKIEHN